MKKLLLAAFLIISIASNAQRMLVLPDTPTFANQNRGVWVFRIADNLPYYSNGVRWIPFTGGLGPSTISDSLTAYNSRVVTSYNGIRGAVKGVDSLWFTNSGTIMHWRWNGFIYSQAIVGGAGVGAWGTITGTISDQSDLQAALNLKLSIADSASMLDPYLQKIDTTGKWITSARRRADSVFLIKGGVEVFVFKDSVGTGGGGSTDTTSLSNRIDNAYNDIDVTADSTGLIFIKPNGIRDTASILGATGGGGGGEVNTASNVGTGAQVFKEKSGVDLRFRSIIGTNGITVTQNTDDITISPTIAVTRGTFAQRPASPDTGQLYWQTDRLAGQWEYDGIEWRFRGVASKFDFNETFSAGAASSVGRLSGLTGGTGSTANIYRQKGGTSYLQLNTGTTTTGYSSYQIAVSEETVLQLDSVHLYREFRVRLPILSDGTETYESAVGWLGHQSLWSFMTLGFHYTHSNNGGRWETRTRKFDNSANMTVKDTGVPVVANQWYKMGIEVNGFTNTIYFYIDDVLVATHTSAENIPIPNSTTGNQYNYGIAKQAGTTARVMDVDHAISYIIKQSY